MNIADAVLRLDELALDAENENYHTLAGVIWNEAIPRVKALEAAATLVVVTEQGVETLEVTP